MVQIPLDLTVHNTKQLDPSVVSWWLLVLMSILCSGCTLPE